MEYKARQRGYKVLGTFSPDQVLPYTGLEASEREFDLASGSTCLVKMTSLRYQTFKKNLRCVCCGIQGVVFLLELPSNDGRLCRPHFNLYAEWEGNLIQMTKDHKQPRSKGGKDHISNMQTMCCTCNELKGNRNMKLKTLRKIQDGSRMIYLVSGSQYMNNVMKGFATTERGIVRIVEKHYKNLYLGEKNEIQVDMSEDRVILKDKDDLLHVFHIHKIERV